MTVSNVNPIFRALGPSSRIWIMTMMMRQTNNATEIKVEAARGCEDLARIRRFPYHSFSFGRGGAAWQNQSRARDPRQSSTERNGVAVDDTDAAGDNGNDDYLVVVQR